MRLGPGWSLVVVTALVAACQDRVPEPDQTAAPVAQGSSLSQKDQLILETAKIALPPDDVKAEDLPEPSSREAGLVVRYCGQCHAFPTPTMHAAVDWPRITQRMWLRMEKLPDTLRIEQPLLSDRVATVNYLVNNALRVSGGALPAGPGRQEFSAMCSRCHALPDPKAHTAEDWPSVFIRMERNMERLKVSTPSPTESQQILTYLQANGARTRR
jgi:cytochrome c5